MKKTLLSVFFLFALVNLFAQVVSTEPVFPKADQPVTITVDVTGTSLDKFAWNETTNPVWIWSWISQGCTTGCDAPTNINPATAAQDGAKVVRISVNPDRYQITFTPTIFFNKPADQIKQIGIKLKSRNWTDEKQTDNDKFITFYDGFALNLISPTQFPLFVTKGDVFSISAKTSEPSIITISINGVQVTTASNVETLTYQRTVSENSGTINVSVSASNGIETKETQFSYIVRSPTPEVKRPAGVIDGINYDKTDPSMVTLGLWAPGKSSVYVVGDFNNWEVSSDYIMKKDGEHFWLKIANLTPGQEYAYQYLVDETVRIGDPYADKILDPDDQYIPATIYPDLKPYPQKAKLTPSYISRASVLQTNQQPYHWKVSDFQKPANEKLVIYELLIRDFFNPENRSYDALMDTITYFKRLGITAVQLMPIMEFNGNDSWGYNPTYMFAPDKAYGPKNKLKEFVDKCHENGIAVILDIAMNHQDIQNPYILMDFDFNANQLSNENKWFNVTARHPYNVFFDMNHESIYTKAYLDTVNYYWLKEFRIDGFRFDLSKGFTQNDRCNGSTEDEGCFFQRDSKRIALLKRMSDRIRLNFPDAILILEHFAENSEEIELSDYGFMLWGNLNHAYNQNTLGLAAGSDISNGYYKSRGWNNSNLITYMESHDEERLMVRNLNSGNSLGDYSARNLETSLQRMRAAGAIFYTIPGPKMIWQFGEYGYDQSINRCPNGTINNDCRVSTKPVLWSYLNDPLRKKLFDHTADLLRLRNLYDVFTNGEATFYGGNSLVKQVMLKNVPYTPVPQSPAEMNVYIVTNFDLVQRTVDASFPHQGSWYEYHNNGEELIVNSAVTKIDLPPGRYKLFTDIRIDSEFTEDPYNLVVASEEAQFNSIMVHPNPANDRISISSQGGAIMKVELVAITGKVFNLPTISQAVYDMSSILPGMYILKVYDGKRVNQFKIVKK